MYIFKNGLEKNAHPRPKTQQTVTRRAKVHQELAFNKKFLQLQKARNSRSANTEFVSYPSGNRLSVKE